MKKKNVILSVLVFIGILLISTISNGAEEIKVEKSVPSTDGSIVFLFSGLTLEDGASYQWAIEKSSTATIENWYSVNAPNYTTGEIQINVNATEKNHLSILKSTDTAYITIKKVDEETNLVEPYKVDLTLPLLKTYMITKSSWYGTAPNNPAHEIKTIYGIKSENVKFLWEKIDDADIVNNYIDNNHDLSGLKLKGIESFPSLTNTKWKSVHERGVIHLNEEPTEDGLYYLWFMGNDTDIKTIKGYAIMEIGKVEKIVNKAPATENQGGNTQTPSTGGQSTDTQNPQESGNSGATNQNPTSGNQNNGSSTEQTPSTGTSSTQKVADDGTTAKTKLPNTGKGIILVMAMILIIITGGISKIKYNTYKDIK